MLNADTKGMVRNTDPDTSKAAAEKILPHRTNKQRLVTSWFRGRGLLGGTDEEMCIAFGDFSSTYRTRRSELVRMGVLENSREKRMMRNGSLAIVWRIKKED